MPKISRRMFLKKCAQATLASGSAYSLLSTMNMVSAIADDADEYKALVCVFLYGGNDSSNMIVPRETDTYSRYKDAKQGLAIPQANLLPVTPTSFTGTSVGLHPAMPEIQDLFENGKLAVLGNVGALIVPTTATEYKQNQVPLPRNLFSHNSQQDFWQAANPSGTDSTGWAGRLADLLDSATAGTNGLPQNISINAPNLMQAGAMRLPYTLAHSGSIPFRGLDISSDRARIFSELLDQSSTHLFENEYAKVKKRAYELYNELDVALAGTPEINSSFSQDSTFAQSMKMVARLISARRNLGATRQIFFVGFDGWDTHGDQLYRHPILLKQLSEGLNAFYDATVELGVENNVTTFTSSEFGRTLTSNGDGSDHGWGGHQFVMGGAVQGRKIFGEIPEVAWNAGQSSDRGIMIPTTSVEQYVYPLATWFGLSPGDISEVLPNSANFDLSNLNLFA